MYPINMYKYCISKWRTTVKNNDWRKRSLFPVYTLARPGWQQVLHFPQPEPFKNWFGPNAIAAAGTGTAGSSGIESARPALCERRGNSPPTHSCCRWIPNSLSCPPIFPESCPNLSLKHRSTAAGHTPTRAMGHQSPPFQGIQCGRAHRPRHLAVQPLHAASTSSFVKWAQRQQLAHLVGKRKKI